MFQNKILIPFLFIYTFVFSQEKKVDTIYVYEEVIVYDTVFIEKPIIKIDKAIFTSENNKKDKLELSQNGKKFQVPVDTLVLITDKKRIEKDRKQSWFFGGKLHLGLASNSLFRKVDAPTPIGFGLGIWTRKELFNSDFSVGIGIDAFYWTSPFSFNASKKDSELNGYYFTKNNEPKLFQSLESKHFQLQIPVQLYYKINKFMPSIGGFVSTSNYKSQFLGSSGSFPRTLDETQTFKAEALQIGYLAEVQYAISKQLSVAVHFSSGKANNLLFTNKDDKNQSFKTKNEFTENIFILQLVYKL
ncbi:MAG: hypothetical protein BGO88_07120 [Flavobacterium sp. 38-13]|uniref:hypothetical protein n=1 Tax=Flavobacterium sp. 38-13 TaxID=1896168 RepID=UPI00095BD2DF|nr:hypothetical protein [Flavobacterium sp. 38-13]OJX50960.1 MAG: hypothetical protein BGO88_07120 [Flavobacterium sp. 38-13]